ncbi:MAG: hypothetical protein J2P15_22520 [Micromonosporaceae bacterium]|nr:hypothetical protein [Micromonosporaceae bacterium]
MRWGKRYTVGAFGAGLVVAGMALGACSGTPSTGGSNGAGSAGGSGGGSTVSVGSVAGVGAALVDQGGRTLYFADQETGGTIHCQDACTRFWIPLTVPAGVTPSAGTGVTGSLAVLQRPDNTRQVTLDGKPLYTFTLDGGPGGAKGNGFTDAFDGTTFHWHAATASGAPATPGATGPGSTPTAGDGGGYGY